MSLLLSMAAFALASSISPGPVNIVALSAGAQFGLRPAMRHVSGATLGFTLLLLLLLPLPPLAFYRLVTSVSGARCCC